MRWVLALLLLVAIPSSAQVPFPGPGRSPSGNGGGGGTAEVCTRTGLETFAESVSFPDPGCGVAGNLAIATVAIDHNNGIIPTGVGMTDLSTIDPEGDGSFICVGTLCRMVVMGRILTGTELWNGDVGSDWTGDTEASAWSMTILSGTWADLDDAILEVVTGSQINATAPTSPSFALAEDATVIHTFALSRLESANFLTPSAPPGSACPSPIIGSGCSFAGNTGAPGFATFIEQTSGSVTVGPTTPGDMSSVISTSAGAISVAIKSGL